MALKLVLEPIFETDFYPASYGIGQPEEPRMHRGDARYINSRSSYEYVVEVISRRLSTTCGTAF